jgi:DNA-binding transcriptional MerR regulator
MRGARSLDLARCVRGYPRIRCYYKAKMIFVARFLEKKSSTTGEAYGLTKRKTMKPTGYPIRAAAKLTGVTVDTLRAWERRYRVVVPERGPRGRLYSPEQVARLRWLRDAVSAGHAIGQVAPLSDRELRTLLNDSRSSYFPGCGQLGAGDPYGRILIRVMKALERYDFLKVDAELSLLAMSLSPRQFVLELLLPLLGRVGSAWEGGNLHIVQEHMVSEIIRSLLGVLMRLYHVPFTRKTILISTPKGEMHEFGILTAALLAVGQGFGVVYLGTNLSAKELLRAIGKTNAALVLLGITRTKGNALCIREVRRLANSLPKGKKLWVGGKVGHRHWKNMASGRMVVLENFEMFEDALRELAST